MHGERGAEYSGAGHSGQRGGRPGLAGEPAGLIQNTQCQHDRQERGALVIGHAHVDRGHRHGRRSGRRYSDRVVAAPAGSVSYFGPAGIHSALVGGSTQSAESVRTVSTALACA